MGSAELTCESLWECMGGDQRQSIITALERLRSEIDEGLDKAAVHGRDCYHHHEDAFHGLRSLRNEVDNHLESFTEPRREYYRERDTLIADSTYQRATPSSEGQIHKDDDIPREAVERYRDNLLRSVRNEIRCSSKDPGYESALVRDMLHRLKNNERDSPPSGKLIQAVRCLILADIDTKVYDTFAHSKSDQQPTNSLSAERRTSRPMATTTSRPKAAATSKRKAITTSRPMATATSKPKAITTSRPDSTTTSKPKATTMSRPKLTKTSRPKATTGASSKKSLSSNETSIGVCDVCSEEVNANTWIGNALTSSCDHGDFTGWICWPCLQRHITSKRLGSQAWSEVNCWAPGCKAILQHRHIRRFASTQDFESYDNFVTRQAIEKDPMYRRCSHSRCDRGGWVDVKYATFFNCRACRRSTCVTCSGPYHQGQTCAESRAGQRKKIDKEDETLAMVARISKRCPNRKCGVNIQKIDGCDHMTCEWTPY